MLTRWVQTIYLQPQRKRNICNFICYSTTFYPKGHQAVATAAVASNTHAALGKWEKTWTEFFKKRIVAAFFVISSWLSVYIHSGFYLLASCLGCILPELIVWCVKRLLVIAGMHCDIDWRCRLPVCMCVYQADGNKTETSLLNCKLSVSDAQSVWLFQIFSSYENYISLTRHIHTPTTVHVQRQKKIEYLTLDFSLAINVYFTFFRCVFMVCWHEKG